ncbi:hydroxyethylthiazole kinase [Desulfovermiculus halophilus]|jgi:hydroxyethylthiazole kinase|uniref:hydroxyethylthiazole kinase n=1 Tax=Desulfovermiculus halophilus TaxID=339722 RepID=UPI000551EDD8|nr:hydroxyethylthiazole kinase [Desulfovermiculus halophilus]
MAKDTGVAGHAAGDILARLRGGQPLVHSITNYVAMSFTANALLALGASPVMAHAREEVEEMVSLAEALVLNIGTLSRDWIESMLIAANMAARHGTPVVLDPVGSGATSLRTQTAKRIAGSGWVSLVRGNASEILSLGSTLGRGKGVDAAHSVQEAEETARILAAELQTVLAITGPQDYITDGRRWVWVENGHPLMGRITGTGCAASAVCAAFMAMERDTLKAAAAALAFFGLAGERAGEAALAPGSFQYALLDALYSITANDLAAKARINGPDLF